MIVQDNLCLYAVENPYTAAQRFLQQNDISMNYMDEVARFIEKNTAGVSLGNDSNYVDPFTGQPRNVAARTGSTN